jgi:hypothetical protein
MTITNFKSDRNYVSWPIIFSQYSIAILTLYDLLRVGWDSVVGIATVLSVRGPNTGVGQIFRTCQDRLWGPTSLLHNGYRFFLGENG